MLLLDKVYKIRLHVSRDYISPEVPLHPQGFTLTPFPICHHQKRRHFSQFRTKQSSRFHSTLTWFFCVCQAANWWLKILQPYNWPSATKLRNKQWIADVLHLDLLLWNFFVAPLTSILFHLLNQHLSSVSQSFPPSSSSSTSPPIAIAPSKSRWYKYLLAWRRLISRAISN